MTDFVGHGTFVTGLIAALDDNGIGGRGVAGNTKILAVRASRDTEGRFFLSDMLRGIDIAIRGKGAHREHEPRRHELHAVAGARARGGLLQRRAARGGRGQPR